MTASAIFTAAHAAARLADTLVAYRTRFTTALRAAWAAAKTTITNTMNTILTTFTKPYADLSANLTEVYDVYTVAENGSAAFAMMRPLDAEDIARFVLLSTIASDRRAQPFATINGVSFYSRKGEGITLKSIESERTQQAYGFTAADVAAFKAAANL